MAKLWPCWPATVGKPGFEMYVYKPRIMLFGKVMLSSCDRKGCQTLEMAHILALVHPIC